MINKTDSNFAFRANLKTTLRFKDAEKFKKLQEMFSEGTKNLPDGTLYLTRAKFGGMSIHTSNVKSGDYFAGEEIFTTTLDEHLEKLSLKDLNKKFINAYKALTLSDKVSAQKKELESIKEEIKNKLAKNLKLAKTLRSLKRDNFAERYEKLADFNRDKFYEIETKIKNLKDKFYRQRAYLSRKFTEIGQVDI